MAVSLIPLPPIPLPLFLSDSRRTRGRGGAMVSREEPPLYHAWPHLAAVPVSLGCRGQRCIILSYRWLWRWRRSGMPVRVTWVGSHLAPPVRGAQDRQDAQDGSNAGNGIRHSARIRCSYIYSYGYAAARRYRFAPARRAPISTTSPGGREMVEMVEMGKMGKMGGRSGLRVQVCTPYARRRALSLPHFGGVGEV